MTETAYYIGDLCYVLREDWDDICVNDDGNQVLSGGREYFLYSTAYGDGCYDDDKGNTYPVDSGTLGAVPVDNILDKKNLQSALKMGLGHIHVLPILGDGDCGVDNGVVYFGEVRIDTDPALEEEDMGDEF